MVHAFEQPGPVDVGLVEQKIKIIDVADTLLRVIDAVVNYQQQNLIFKDKDRVRQQILQLKRADFAQQTIDAPVEVNIETAGTEKRLEQADFV